MQIEFEFPHVFSRESSPLENARVLRAALDFLIDVNIAFLDRSLHPGRVWPSIYDRDRAGSPWVVYGRTQTWDSIPMLFHKRFGDCKSLTAARIAEYRSQGIPASPVFRFMPHSSGQDYHILIQLADGTFEDPSRKLGMGTNENAYFQR